MLRRSMAAGMLLLIPIGLRAQSSPPDPPLQSVLEIDLLRDLPASANVFSILETSQQQISSDRFYTGGLSTGEPARLGAQLASPGQNRFRIGEIDIADPDGSGTPMLFPELLYWRSVGVFTGLMPAHLNAPGLAISLEPREPTERWSGVAEGFGSPGWVASGPSSGPPSIARLNSWGHAGSVVSGRPIPERLGVTLGASWTRGSQFIRDQTDSVTGTVGSGFGHLVFTPSRRDEVRFLGWAQRSVYPSTERQSARAAHDASLHGQATWKRQLAEAAWSVFGGVTRRSRSLDASTASLLVERLSDGPVPELPIWRDTSSRQVSVGTQITSPVRVLAGKRHATAVRAEFEYATGHYGGPFTGWIGELLDGDPARAWMFSAGVTDSRRSVTSVAVSASDAIEVTPRVTAGVGLRFDATGGSANGAAADVSWHSWLPHGRIRWLVTDKARTAIYGGYTRSADRLLFPALAYGDPAAHTALVYRWDTPTPDGAASAPLSPPGPLVARIGPGTGGNPAFSGIDSDLRRPLTDELIVGMESYLNSAIRWQLTGIGRWPRNDLALQNVGVSLQDYSVFTVPNPGGAASGPSTGATDPIPVYDRLPSSFGRDRYVLTNSPLKRARYLGVDLNFRITTGRLWIMAGGSAQLTEAQAAYRGFRVIENDQGVLGDVLADPNSTTFAYGRPFLDRGFTGKITLRWTLPKDIRIGALIRYQDGQPFSALMVIPGLGQGRDTVRGFENGGTRFTFVGTADMRVQKGLSIGGRRVDAILDVYNLAHLQKPVEEHPVVGPRSRSTTAIQPPLAVHMGVRFTL